MKRYLLTISLAFVIILLAGCSKIVQLMQNFEADKGVRIYEGDKRVIFNLRTLPYDMEYKNIFFSFHHVNCIRKNLMKVIHIYPM